MGRWSDHFTESLPDMELVGQQCFAFVSDLALSMNDKTSVRVFGPVTGNLGQQLRRRREGGDAPRSDQCKFGPFGCKNLRADFSLLGVWLTQNLYGACHFRFRYKKCLKAIGKLNRIWCNHPGMTLKEEWQLWNMFGWSTLTYASEIWPFQSFAWAEKAEAHFLRIFLRVTFTTNYFALCWYVGILPARFRLVCKALRFLYRLGYSKNQFEQDALQAQFDMWSTVSRVFAIWTVLAFRTKYWSFLGSQAATTVLLCLVDKTGFSTCFSQTLWLRSFSLRASGLPCCNTFVSFSAM